MRDADIERKAAIYRAALEVGDVYSKVVSASRSGDVDLMFQLLWDLAWLKLRDLEQYRRPR